MENGKVRGEQITDVLSSHNKELCHVDELKNLAIFLFLSQWFLGRKIVLQGWKLCRCNLNLHSRCKKEKRDQLSGDSGD